MKKPDKIYIEGQLCSVSPLPPENYKKFGFKIQLFNGEFKLKTNHLNITPEQFKKIESILIKG